MLVSVASAVRSMSSTRVPSRMRRSRSAWAESALLLSALHAGERADWDFEDLRRRGSAWLRDKSLNRVEQLFEGRLRAIAHAVVQAAYSALEHRHVAMHTVWTLTGQDAFTPAADLVAALESSDPDGGTGRATGPRHRLRGLARHAPAHRRTRAGLRRRTARHPPRARARERAV